MKKGVTYILVVLMFIAVNFQSVCYLMYASGHTIELSPNFLSEEERHESEESSDLDVEKKKLEYLHLNTENLFVTLDKMPFGQDSKLKFVSSNFSGTIYTPPDLLFI